MPKEWIDWSDWDGKVSKPSHPLSRPLNKNIKTGADSVHDALVKGELPILGDAPKQPTNEQLFGHLVVTDEMVEKAEKEWKDKIQDGISEASKPIDHRNGSTIKGSLKSGKSFNDIFKEELTEQEMLERNRSL